MDNKTNNNYGKLNNFRNENSVNIAAESEPAKKGVVNFVRSLAQSTTGKVAIAVTVIGLGWLGFKVYRHFKPAGDKTADAPKAEGDNNE